MTGQRLQRARVIFEKLVDLPAEQRGPILAEDCDGDEELRAFVEELLANCDGGMEEFLATPAYVSDTEQPAEDVKWLPRQIGHYEIVRVVGEGGMGVVYEARQENPARTVALKVIRPGLASGHVVRRFHYEAAMLGRLQHPGIACIYEAGTAEIEAEQGPATRRSFFAMEFVHGEPLNAHASDRKLSIRERLQIVARICDAVQHAHQKGVIHRDLKPKNILVDASGQPKILDFGIARAVDASARTATWETHAGQLIGTLPYMSPEQVVGDPAEIDTRSDVYALGVILYELLSGEPPYKLDSKSIPEAARVIHDQQPPRLGSINRDLRGEIETIVAKALEKDKIHRYQSALALAADIRRFLAGEPIEAKSDSGWYLLRKTLARYRAAVGIAAAFVVLITAATIALGIMYRGQTLARAAEEQQRRLAETNEARAKDETAKAKAVIGLLQDMLSSASPYEEKGPDYTVRQLLDDFVAGLHDQLADQPEVEATVRQTVGKTYGALGLYADAERQLRAALDIQQRLLEDQHPDVIASRNALAELLIRTGQHAEAEQHLRIALEAARRCWDAPHEQIATILNNLALVLQARGAYDEAEALLRDTLAIRRQLLGDVHEHVAVSLNNLAVLLRIKGDYAGAEPLYREALAIRRRLFGNEHPHVATSLNNLALLLHHRGQYDEAEALYREALAIVRKTLPAGHPDIANILNSLAGLLQLRGDLDGAETLFREALAIRRKALPAQHPAVARSLSNLGTVLRYKGECAEAEALYREALAIVRAALPEDHPVIAARMENLALLLVEQRRLAEAEALLREALAIRQKALPSGDRALAETESKLGGCLTLAGRYDEAEALLFHSHEILKDSPEDATPAQREIFEENLKRIVQLYDAWGRPEQAAEWRAKLPAAQPADELTEQAGNREAP
jgi:tetratricopeptide (TPR) repeat protein/predicted Ser/Thr protein kinase